MAISILDQWKIFKTPILIFANINTDIITLYVVFTAVFVFGTQSIAIWLILVFYLRFYLIVHNRILNLLSENGILKKLNESIAYIYF